MVIRSRGQQIEDFKPKCRIQMYYYRMYSIYPEKCDDPGGEGTAKNVTGYSVSTY
jgi:hypothetical protein